jgi:hypothetical protein
MMCSLVKLKNVLCFSSIMLPNLYQTTWHHIPQASNLHITTVRMSDVRATIIIAVEKAIKQCHISCAEL